MVTDEKNIEVHFKTPSFNEQIELGAHWSYKGYPIIDEGTKNTPEVMFWLSKENEITYVMDLMTEDVETIEDIIGMGDLQRKCKEIVRSHYRDHFEESVENPRKNFIEWFFKKG